VCASVCEREIERERERERVCEEKERVSLCDWAQQMRSRRD